MGRKIVQRNNEEIRKEKKKRRKKVRRTNISNWGEKKIMSMYIKKQS